MTFVVRDMHKDDVEACVAIINPIIALGGSTAYEDPYEATAFDAHYRVEAKIANVVTLDGRVVGFQSAFEVEDGVYSVGSFTDQQNPVKGAGRAIIAKTIADARALGGSAILAKITSDNTGGLAYYTSVGFKDFTVVPNDHTRKNGVTVDRIIKRLVL